MIILSPACISSLLVTEINSLRTHVVTLRHRWECITETWVCMHVGNSLSIINFQWVGRIISTMESIQTLCDGETILLSLP